MKKKLFVNQKNIFALRKKFLFLKKREAKKHDKKQFQVERAIPLGYK